MWLSDVRLILPGAILERGSLRIEAGRIAEIIEGPAPRPGLNARGLTAFPGIVDVHGDMLEREIEPRPGAHFPVDLALFELDKRLAATGVTTEFAAISFHWHSNNLLRSEERAREIINTVNRLRASLLTDFYVHARFEITVPEAGPVLSDLLHAHQVHLVSLMDHTPGQGQYRDIERYIRTMVEWRKVTRGITVEADDMRAHVREAQGRPKSWDIVNDVARRAMQRAIPLASHDDDTEVKVSLMAGLGVSICEFPVTLEAAQEARDRRMWVVMGAPNALRGGSHSNNLSALEGLEAGVVDILASDYFPASLLHAVCAIAEKGILSWPEAVKVVSLNPARAAGLHDRGSLEVGQLADIALVEMAARPRVRGTLRRGVPIYWDSYMAALARLSPSSQPSARRGEAEAPEFAIAH